jgi:hypothetical protein
VKSRELTAQYPHQRTPLGVRSLDSQSKPSVSQETSWCRTACAAVGTSIAAMPSQAQPHRVAAPRAATALAARYARPPEAPGRAQKADLQRQCELERRTAPVIDHTLFSVGEVEKRLDLKGAQIARQSAPPNEMQKNLDGHWQ